MHPSILFLHGRGVFKEVICLEDDVLAVGEVSEQEGVVSVDIFELVDVMVGTVVERGDYFSIKLLVSFFH